MDNKVGVVRKEFIKIYFYFFNKIIFRDKYGLSYYLWSNTRPIGTYERGVRTDDETLLQLSLKIIDILNKNKKNPLVCFDVGGFIGVITLTMLKALRGNGIVHIFEPVRESYHRICDNLKLNNHANAVVNNFAIADYSGLGLQNVTTESGSDFLQKLQDNSGNMIGNDLSVRGYDLDVNNQQITLVMSLNKYMKICSIDWVDLIKIDAEAVDHLVLSGGEEFFYDQKFGFILIEYVDGSECGTELLSMLTKANYKIFYMVRNSGKLVTNLDNYPSDHVSCLNIMAVSSLVESNVLDELLQDTLIH